MGLSIVSPCTFKFLPKGPYTSHSGPSSAERTHSMSNPWRPTLRTTRPRARPRWARQAALSTPCAAPPSLRTLVTSRGRAATTSKRNRLQHSQRIRGPSRAPPATARGSRPCCRRCSTPQRPPHLGPHAFNDDLRRGSQIHGHLPSDWSSRDHVEKDLGDNCCSNLWPTEKLPPPPPAWRPPA